MYSNMRHPFQQLYSHTNSDDDDDGLVPDMPSWPSSMFAFEDETFQPQGGYIPRDVVRSDGEMAWDERSTVIDVIDRTSLSTDFDHSCLDSLDDRLLLSPTESFADVCWDTAVYDEPDRDVTPTPPHIDTTGLYTAVRRRHSQDDSEEDSLLSDDDPSTPIFEKEAVDSDDLHYAETYPNYLSNLPIDTFVETIHDDYDEKKSFMVLDPTIVIDPTFSMSNPYDTVNYFPYPIRPTNRGNLPTRFITFCAKFPARLRATG